MNDYLVGGLGVFLLGVSFGIVLHAWLGVAPLQKEIQHLERQLQHERAKEPQSIVFRL